MIVIVDYGMGNLGSIQNMLRRIGEQARISSDIREIEAADKLILPGVGAFDNGMRRIEEGGLRPVLDRKAKKDKIPIFGICLGMQLLFEGSAEGRLAGMGWLPGRSIRFDFGDQANRPKVPHMGWNSVIKRRESPLLDDVGDDSRFYFVHSFHVVCDDPTHTTLSAFHGYEFTAAVQSENIFGVQFHPEKSHRYGRQLFENFVKC